MVDDPVGNAVLRFAPPPRGSIGAVVATTTFAVKAETRGPPELTFAEVKELVEEVSPALLLKFDEDDAASTGKGRYLVAKRPIKTGEVLLSEWPLFTGSTDATQSRCVYEEGFLALAALEEDEDLLHPCSSLVDCVAGVLLAKRTAAGLDCDGDETEKVEKLERCSRAQLRLRKLATLSFASVEEPVLDGLARGILGRLLPELRDLTSEEELRRIIGALCNNRFGGAESNLDVMFAGSMFEHSCTPNCFLVAQ